MSDDSEFGNLPALKGLGRLADLRPVLVTDSREVTPFIFTRLPSVVDGLQTGDYSIKGAEDLFMVERKSLSDMVGCCMGERERFCREMHRARGFRFARLLIIATEDEIENAAWRSKFTTKAFRASMSSFEVNYIPIVFSPTPEAGALLVEKWAWWFSRSLVEACNDLLRGSTPPIPTT
jgi:ERCC4-type nuclease